MKRAGPAGLAPRDQNGVGIKTCIGSCPASRIENELGDLCGVTRRVPRPPVEPRLGAFRLGPPRRPPGSLDICQPDPTPSETSEPPDDPAPTSTESPGATVTPRLPATASTRFSPFWEWLVGQRLLLAVILIPLILGLLAMLVTSRRRRG